MPTRENLAPRMLPREASLVEWRVSDGLVPYADAVAFMEARADAIATGAAGELIWLLEHPPLYTAGTSAREGDLLEARFPVHKSGRGGQFTYHGPGQRIAYVMLDLNRRNPDLRAFVCSLEAWLIAALAAFNVKGERRPDRIGVWVARPAKRVERAARPPRTRSRRSDPGPALGFFPWHRAQCRAGSHAFCWNRALRDFGRAFWVTSLHDLGVLAGMGEVDAALRTTFAPIFGKTEQV